SVCKRIFFCGAGIAEYTRDQPHDAVNDSHGRNFTACQHIVADGKFLEVVMALQILANSFIISFIVAANYNEMGARGQLACPLLAVWFSLRTHQQYFGILGPFMARGGTVAF